MRAETEIVELIQPILTSRDVRLVDLILRGAENRRVLEIFIDTEQGVTADLCTNISREVSRLLDRNDIIHGKYDLIVSSPGVDRPLKSLWQYRRNLGRKLLVKVQGENGKKTISGTLTDCNENGIQLLADEETSLTLSYEAIMEAKVCLPW